MKKTSIVFGPVDGKRCRIDRKQKRTGKRTRERSVSLVTWAGTSWVRLAREHVGGAPAWRPPSRGSDSQRGSRKWPRDPKKKPEKNGTKKIQRNSLTHPQTIPIGSPLITTQKKIFKIQYLYLARNMKIGLELLVTMLNITTPIFVRINHKRSIRREKSLFLVDFWLKL